MAVRDWFAQEMSKDGLAVSRDAVNNLFGRFGPADGPCVMAGSHLDTVPEGGAFGEEERRLVAELGPVLESYTAHMEAISYRRALADLNDAIQELPESAQAQLRDYLSDEEQTPSA